MGEVVYGAFKEAGKDSNEQRVFRALSEMTGIDVARMKSGCISAEEFSALRRANDRLDASVKLSRSSRSSVSDVEFVECECTLDGTVVYCEYCDGTGIRRVWPRERDNGI